MRVEIRIAEGHGELHPVGCRYHARFESYERDLISLMLRQKRVRFGEHVQWACDIQGLHTIKYDNGDFHFVTFIDCKHAHG
ncbi:hypothetical protein PTKU64_71460 [Paraburkholderia terrae]|uniref:Uncharacterized protein n=1 Tax=Paraburkholderia terrae TaxID=311230 RepID=A0ABM7TXT8_9BURK|nr:hypothetical protein PTKU64_71460 [Paraburkholderia terrae]